MSNLFTQAVGGYGAESRDRSLVSTLEDIAAAIGESVGFATVAVNLYRPAWADFEVVAVHGNRAARRALIGGASDLESWLPLLAPEFECAGAYFVPAEASTVGYHGVPTWEADPTGETAPGDWDVGDSLLVPLWNSEGIPLCVISVDEPASGRRPSPADMQAIVALAQYAGIAVERAQEAEAARAHGAALQHLLGVSAELNASLDADALLSRICEAIREALGFEIVSVSLVEDRETGRLRRCAVAGIPLEDHPDDDVHLIEHVTPIFDGEWETEGCFLLPSQAARALLSAFSPHRSVRNGRGPQAWNDHSLVVPLWQRDGSLRGYVSVDEPRDRVLPDRERLQALRAFANQATTALEAIERAGAQAEAKSELRRERDRARQLLDVVETAVLMLDAAGRVVLLNRHGHALLGRPEGSAIGLDWFETAIPEVERQLLSDAFRRALQGDLDGIEHFENHVLRADGELRLVAWHNAILRDESGGITGILSAGRDVTEERRNEEELARLAYHDPLTGLPNRLCLEQALERAIERARTTGGGAALLYVDLDDFKLINDSLGHAAGDQLLCAVAERLQRLIRPCDALARHGGDEFLLVLGRLETDDPRQTVEKVAERIIASLGEPLEVAGAEIAVSASIGVSLYPRDASSAEAMLQNADAAMYQAKGTRRSSFALYELGGPDPRERLALTSRLHRAVERSELELHYQPIQNLVTGEMEAVEALLRWRQPDGSFIPPSDFIPIAEDVGLIEPIGEWVIDEACAQIAEWRRGGLDLVASVNVSARQLIRADLADQVLDALARHSLPPSAIVVELTESAVMHHPDRGMAVLEQLDGHGIGIAIDDFGAGWSSLGRLRELPVRTLKIDRCFLSGVPEDPAAASLVRAIVDLASTLGKHVVSEGVETAEQLEFVKRCGCPYAQGYHLGRPVPPADIPLASAVG